MKICIVSFYSPQTSSGGLERYLNTILKEFDKRNITVHFVTASYSKKNEVETKGNITYHKLKAMSLKTRNKHKAAKNLFKYVKHLVKKEEIDIISAENFHKITPPTFVLALNLISLELKTPIVLKIHTQFKKNKPKILEKIMLKDLFWDKIITVSKSTTNNIYDAGLNINKISTVCPPVNTDVFRPGLGNMWLKSRINVNEKDQIILHASRITGNNIEEKGIKTLIETFSILNKHNKNIKLLIATATPPPSNVYIKNFKESEKKIKELAKVNNIQDKIIVKSFKLEEMPLVYNGADIFVMASKNESFGFVYAEASACELPVIGTSAGGVPEIIDNEKTGYLIDPNSPVNLSKKIQTLLNSKKKRVFMGKHGRKIIKERFNLNKTIDNLLGPYKSVIQNKK